jgi:hypothetical protein
MNESQLCKPAHGTPPERAVCLAAGYKHLAPPEQGAYSESHQRQLVDGSSPFYQAAALPGRTGESHITLVCGSFKSDLFMRLRPIHSPRP